VIQIRLLIVMKLLESNLSYHVLPKTEMKGVDEIYIIRDYPGPDLPKVNYHCPPKSLLGHPIFLILAKIYISFYISLTKKPDMIISYAMYPHGIIAFLAAKLTKRPLVISIIHINEMDGYGFFFPRLYLCILKRCEVITTTGSKTKEKLVARGISPEKILLLPHAVHTDRFYPTFARKNFDILFLGGISQRKHPDILIKALHKAKKASNKHITLCIAGKGNPN
jgi:glycosyltransferase involved in cell wall biosynthesis